MEEVDRRMQAYAREETNLCTTGIRRAAGERRPAKEKKVRRARRTSRKVATVVVTMVPMVVVQTEKEEEVGRGS